MTFLQRGLTVSLHITVLERLHFLFISCMRISEFSVVYAGDSSLWFKMRVGDAHC